VGPRKSGLFGTLPRPVPFHFQLHNHAEEGTDQYDQSEDQHVLQCERNDNRSNNIAGDEELKPPQDGPSPILPVELIRFAGLLLPTNKEAAGGEERTLTRRLELLVRFRFRQHDFVDDEFAPLDWLFHHDPISHDRLTSKTDTIGRPHKVKMFVRLKRAVFFHRVVELRNPAMECGYPLQPPASKVAPRVVEHIIFPVFFRGNRKVNTVMLMLRVPLTFDLAV
jgi:hypothetical protein